MNLKPKKTKAMETKKSLRKSLEKGKSISFMMGMIVALSVLFTGFEWGERDINIDTNYKANPLFGDVEDVVITRPEPPEPPKPEITKMPDLLVVVDNDKEVEPAVFAPTEDNTGTPQPVYVPTFKEEKEEAVIDEIYVSVEIMPEFTNGSLLKWIAEQINYPTIAAENGIDGLVSCSFVVNADGSISNVEVLRSRDPLLDKEAVRVLKLMPKWKPGMQQGKNVRVKYSVPVRFRLQK